MTERSTDLAQLQRALVDDLRRRGLMRGPGVEAAFRAVPRHLFLPDIDPVLVYQDEAIATHWEDGAPVSSSSQPAMMALMLDQLDLRPGQRVLEIGAGTGYNAALIAQIVGPRGLVVTVDIDQAVADQARRGLDAAGFPQVEVVCGDGGLGYAPAAPYDRVIVTAGAEDLPPAWRDQLRPDGRIVLPLSLYGAQKSVALRPAGDHLASTSLIDCAFVSLRGAFAGHERRLRLPAFPQVRLEAFDGRQHDPAAIEALLAGPFREETLPFAVSRVELLGVLWLWLGLHGLPPCRLWAEAGAEAQPLPTLCSMGGPRQAMALGYIEGRGMLLWGHGPDSDGELGWNEPAPLYARVYGEGQALLGRLAGAMARWESRGRPQSSAVRLRVYPRDTPYECGEGEFLLPRRSTNIVVSMV